MILSLNGSEHFEKLGGRNKGWPCLNRGQFPHQDPRAGGVVSGEPGLRATGLGLDPPRPSWWLPQLPRPPPLSATSPRPSPREPLGPAVDISDKAGD